MKVKSRVSNINVILVSLTIVSAIMAVAIINLPKLKAKIENTIKSSKIIKNTYSEETTNQVDISKNGDGSVIATLASDGTLTISGSGEMKDFSSSQNIKDILNSTEITKVVIENGVTNIGNYAFFGCENLSDITIPSSVINIGKAAFYKCGALINIDIPEGVESIKEDTFYECNNLTSIIIPSGVKNIKSNAFNGCNSLTEITVDNNNEKYMDVNGVLYTKDKTTIIKYPPKKEETEYEILEGVTSIGAYAFYQCTNLNNIKIPDTVTTIGYSAFHSCSKLTNINISEGVTSIEGSAFLGCANLKTINMPSGVTSIGNLAFFVCESLESINIPSSVVSIGDRAFAGCKSLTSINIPNGITNIGNDVFSGCIITKIVNKGEEINLPDILQRTQNENDILHTSKELLLTNCTIEGTKIVPNPNETYVEIYVQDGSLKGLTYILAYTEWDISENGDGSIIASLTEDGKLTISGTGNMKDWNHPKERLPDWYYNGINVKIKNVVINEGIKNIGKYAFYECSNLTEINIPKGVTSIGSNSFWACSNLTSINIPEEVTIIGDWAFEGCRNLSSLNIHNNITSIGECAFNDCDSLEEIKVDENNTQYMDDNGVLYTKDKTKIIKYPAKKSDTKYIILKAVTSVENYAFEGCNNLISIEIPNSVTRIGMNAFWGCSSITSINIPSTITSIGTAAFSGCSSLTNINIPEGVTNLGYATFEGCSSLTSINIPEGVTSIGMYAYSNCSSLTSIEIPNSVTSIGSRAFDGCSNLMLICDINSTAHNYAKENKVNYLATNYNKANDYFKGIQPETTTENIVKNIDTNMEYQITENNKEVIGSELIKTGQKLVVNNKTYTLVVTGDVNGDGQTNIVDLSRLKLAIVGTLNLEGEYKEATDVNSNGQTLQLTDLSKMKLYIVGKTTI